MNSQIIYKNAEKKVVFIGLEKIPNEIGNQKKIINIIGSGFLVKDNEGIKLISAAHVFQQARAIVKAENAKVFIGVYKDKIDNITQFELKNIDIDGVLLDHKNDLGAVSVLGVAADNSYILDDLRLSDDYEAGVKCTSIGFPLVNEFMAIGVGITLFVSSSLIASVKYNSQSKEINFLLTDTHINPSSSGSPFFEEETGKIIGVVSGTFQNNFVAPVMAENKIQMGIQVPRNIGLVRPSSLLKGLLKYGTSS